MTDFKTLGIPQTILDALEALKLSTPTPIQASAIPVALAGRDVLGSAQTGTGKTFAFAIPLLAHLLNKPQSAALVMTPTRELAGQVIQAIHQLLGRASPIRTALLIGGETMQKQFRQLDGRPRLIVGTPGRINDHLNRRTLDLRDADFLVLDESDRMLDMGFGIQIDKIIKQMPHQRQTLLFSATLPPHIVKLADKYQRQPERIAVGSTTTPIDKITQELVRTTTLEKYDALVAQLDKRAGSIIVFVRTKHGADRLAKKLSREDFNADAIHGDLKQNRRERVIRDFREKKSRILVATDVAARGLDIPHIEHVINFDLPQCPEDYIHRIGRTARAGAEGAAVCLITSEDGSKWNAIQRLIDPNWKQPAQPYNQGQKQGKRRGKRPHRKGGGGGNRFHGGGRHESRAAA